MSRIYTTLDLRSGYHHMVLSTESRPKSAFVTLMETFDFTSCPFGLTKVLVYFQRLIYKVLHGLDFAFGYLSDILVFSPDIEIHLKHLEIIFQRIREADLKLEKVNSNF